ncbi:MAG: Quinate/shikimate dehydrogenase [Lentisphaerae bacterium ADurb.BinA184]|nr:MAG: Quinate/shikimate dehydrogenase [Lentisphaerae bacterium ADurb.BinA184]
MLSPGDLPAIRAALAGCDVLVQATSLGLRAGDPLPLPAGGLPAGLRVMDMICRHTPFLEAAGAAGCVTADGRAMLLHQGARSFSIWTGREAPLAAMRAALDAALAASSGGTPHAPAVRPERPSANAD